MHTPVIFCAALAALVVAAPTSLKRQSKYYGISINVNAVPSGQPAVYEPAPVEINKLTSLGNNTSASELVFDHGVAINVDLDKVECRAYKDQDGVVPGSAPFTNARPAELSTNLVAVGSILCYIVE